MKRQMNLNKKITQKEIAKLANVSQGTVSIVLSNLPMISRIPDATRRKILNFAIARNYVRNAAARHLRIGKSDLIAVIVPHIFSYYLQDLITSIESRLLEQGYNMVVLKVDTEGAEIEKKLRKMLELNYHGIICLEHFAKNAPSLIPGILASFGNVIYLEKPIGSASARYVSVDYSSGVVEAVRHLVKRGKKRIALCLNDRLYLSMKGRFTGYRKGLEKSGVRYKKDFCWYASDYGFSGKDSSPLEGIAMRIYNDVLIKLKADAVIMSNDEWAVSLIKILRKNGHNVPAEISVVGYGNFSAICWASEPELTSINHGNEEIASLLCSYVIDTNCKMGKMTNSMVQSHLVVRHSS